ncbi:heat shock protein transcriptional repressor HspR [Phoenicibacter congonensis]|uniref:heat shock protein transcriptional repressor HspR n=1 Tax=Phoenicibacter congonensis TaxID=1944646 RepID=UPI0009A79E1A|nr:MerR family transcriptional regulator [Phoenicibacter congonensis]
MKSRDTYHKPMFTIGVVADLAGVHPQTLRSYEQKGLLTPQRTHGNTRMYSQADIDRLFLIIELTDEGINLAGVMRILTLQGKLDETEEALEEAEKRLDDLHDKLQRISRHFTQLGPARNDAKQENSMVKASDISKLFFMDY